MANRTYLIPHTSSDPGVNDLDRFAVLKAANYSLPVLWLALFKDRNRASRSLEVCDAEGQSFFEEFPTLHTSLSNALENWGQRRGVLEGFLPEELHTYLRRWDDTLSALATPFIQVELSELAMMMEPQEFEESLNLSLSALDTLDETALAEFFSQAAFEFRSRNAPIGYDEATVEFNLLGFDW